MSTASPLQKTANKSQAVFNSKQAGLLLQRKCACGTPTSSLTGSCPECQRKKKIQTKLTIGASNDPLEQEADRVADQVLATPANPATSNVPPRIQRHTGQASGDAVTAAPPSVDQVLASPGKPLDVALQRDMNQRFKHDFARVRIHSDAAAQQSAREVHAHAYTTGHNIVFGANQFSPTTHAGRRLLAHELTHVVQQSGVSTQLQRQETSGTPADPCTYAGEAVKDREVHLNLNLSAARVYTNGGGHEQFNNLITGPSTQRLAGCHMYSVKGHQLRSSHGLINFVNYCGDFGFHSNFWHKNGRIERIPGDQSAGCARLQDADDTSTASGDSHRFYNLVQNDDCVRIYDRSFWRPPTFKRCPSAGESC